MHGKLLGYYLCLSRMLCSSAISKGAFRMYWTRDSLRGFGTTVGICLLCFSSQSEKLLLFDTVQSELEEKIRRLEEDRHSIDITSGTLHT